MSEGWVKIHRQIQENEFWYSEPFSRGQAWIDLILLANHNDGFIYVRGNKVIIKRGQVGWSQTRLASRWKWSRKKVAKFLNDLQEEQQVEHQKNNICTIISVVNYNKYQNKDPQKEQQENRRGAAKEPQKHTNKNEKNVNNDKEGNPILVRLHEKPDVMRMSDLLLEKIIKWNPEHRYARNKPSLNKWDKDIDRAMRLDGRTAEQLELMVRYIFEKNTPVAQFWADNIQSGEKLREKFDKVAGQIKREHTNKGRYHGYEEPDAEYIYKQSQRILEGIEEISDYSP